MIKKIFLGFAVFVLLLVGAVIAQVAISFPQTFEIQLPNLPIQQSPNQIIFNCPYDQNMEYRMVGIKDLSWSGNIPTVIADVKYWTKDRKCAGSKSFNITLPITLSQNALVSNFQTRIDSEFIQEALANRQRLDNRNIYIAGSSVI